MAASEDEVTGALLSFEFASSSADYSSTFILIKTHDESHHLSFTTRVAEPYNSPFYG
jgi:hypothetical protein